MNATNFLSSLQSVTLKNVPEDEIKVTPPFESCFDLITLNTPRDTPQPPLCTCNDMKNLYLGALSSTRDEDMLRLHNITTVVSMTDASFPHFDGINYFRYPIQDSIHENLSAILDEVCSVIGEGMETGSVLVHCNFGVSRSGSVVVAYKGRSEHLSLTKALAQVQQDRSCVCPNDAFMQQLEEFLA